MNELNKILVIEADEQHLPTYEGVDTIHISSSASGKDYEIDIFLADTLQNRYDLIVMPYSLSVDYSNYTGLRIAAHIRLTPEWQNKKTPILFVGAEPIEIVAKLSSLGSLLFTPGVFHSANNSSEIEDVINSIGAEITPLTDVQYANFIAKITIEPLANLGSNHSIANIWGVNTLSKALGLKCCPEDNGLLKSLYFKYIQEKSRRIEIDNTIRKEAKKNLLRLQEAAINWLLIDDQANRGWEQLLRELLPKGTGDCICERIDAYGHLSTDAKRKIENNKYDIIFLDLRLAGDKEDVTYMPDKLSGYSVLEKIKQLNPGTQVLIFTASNKVWNYRTLHDKGADGYYIKESPEYSMSPNFTSDNTLRLLKEITKCIKNKYQRDIWAKMQDAYAKLESLCMYDLHQVVKDNWDAGFKLLRQNAYREALMQFILAIEAYCNQYVETEWPDTSTATVKLKDGGKGTIFNAGTIYYQTVAGTFDFQKASGKPSTKNIVFCKEGKPRDGKASLTLLLKIAAVLNAHLGTIPQEDMEKMCEMVFIRNNRLAHHGAAGVYDERKRPITEVDCQDVFDITYRLIMA